MLCVIHCDLFVGCCGLIVACSSTCGARGVCLVAVVWCLMCVVVFCSTHVV